MDMKVVNVSVNGKNIAFIIPNKMTREAYLDQPYMKKKIRLMEMVFRDKRELLTEDVKTFHDDSCPCVSGKDYGDTFPGCNCDANVRITTTDGHLYMA